MAENVTTEDVGSDDSIAGPGSVGDEHGETSTGLDENVAGALAYLFGVVTGLVFFLVENENRFVRFHAAQSIVLFGGVFVLSVLLSVVGTAITTTMFAGGTGGFLVGGIVSMLLGLVWLALTVGAFVSWIYLMIRAYQGKTPRVPVVAGIADSLVD